MSYKISDAISAVSTDNTTVFQDTVNNILADKLRERIGVEKVSVAQTMFAEPGETPDETPEELETEIDGESDEDV